MRHSSCLKAGWNHTSSGMVAGRMALCLYKIENGKKKNWGQVVLHAQVHYLHFVYPRIGLIEISGYCLQISFLWFCRGNCFRGNEFVRELTTAECLHLVKVFVLHHHECVVHRQPVLAHKNRITWCGSHSSASPHPSEALCWWGSEIKGVVWCGRGEASVLHLGLDLDLPSGILWFAFRLCTLLSPHVTFLEWILKSSLMALSFLIRHIKGLKMRLFSVSHTLLNQHHKQVSIQTPEDKWV